MWTSGWQGGESEGTVGGGGGPERRVSVLEGARIPSPPFPRPELSLEAQSPCVIPAMRSVGGGEEETGLVTK